MQLHFKSIRHLHKHMRSKLFIFPYTLWTADEWASVLWRIKQSEFGRSTKCRGEVNVTLHRLADFVPSRTFLVAIVARRKQAVAVIKHHASTIVDHPKSFVYSLVRIGQKRLPQTRGNIDAEGFGCVNVR